MIKTAIAGIKICSAIRLSDGKLVYGTLCEFEVKYNKKQIGHLAGFYLKALDPQFPADPGISEDIFDNMLDWHKIDRKTVYQFDFTVEEFKEIINYVYDEIGDVNDLVEWPIL
jgi:hypothetical protein